MLYVTDRAESLTSSIPEEKEELASVSFVSLNVNSVSFWRLEYGANYEKKKYLSWLLNVGHLLCSHTPVEHRDIRAVHHMELGNMTGWRWSTHLEQDLQVLQAGKCSWATSPATGLFQRTDWYYHWADSALSKPHILPVLPQSTTPGFKPCLVPFTTERMRCLSCPYMPWVPVRAVVCHLPGWEHHPHLPESTSVETTGKKRKK